MYREPLTAVKDDQTPEQLLETAEVCHKLQMTHLLKALEPDLSEPETIDDAGLLQLYRRSCRWSLPPFVNDVTGCMVDRLGMEKLQSASTCRPWAGLSGSEVFRNLIHNSNVS